MLVYRLCISVLLTCIILHFIGLSQFNTRWSVSSAVLTHLLRDYVRFLCFQSFVSCLCCFCCYSTSASDCLERLGSEMTLSYNLLMSTSSLTHSHQTHSTILSEVLTIRWLQQTRTPALIVNRSTHGVTWMKMKQQQQKAQSIDRTATTVNLISSTSSMHWLDEYPALCDC